MAEAGARVGRAPRVPVVIREARLPEELPALQHVFASTRDTIVPDATAFVYRRLLSLLLPVAIVLALLLSGASSSSSSSSWLSSVVSVRFVATVSGVLGACYVALRVYAKTQYDGMTRSATVDGNLSDAGGMANFAAPRSAVFVAHLPPSDSAGVGRSTSGALVAMVGVLNPRGGAASWYNHDEVPADGAFADDEATITRVGTLAAYCGNGIAASLLRAAEDWCREQGYARVKLLTSTVQFDAVRLYTRCGYRVVYSRPATLGIHSICFQKDLLPIPTPAAPVSAPVSTADTAAAASTPAAAAATSTTASGAAQ